MDAAFFPDNRIDLLETGSEYFPALIEAIEAAQAEVRIETYIFADDAIGRLVSAALARAARRVAGAVVVGRVIAGAATEQGEGEGEDAQGEETDRGHLGLQDVGRQTTIAAQVARRWKAAGQPP